MPKRKIDWFGPRLRELREAAGLSQAALGQRVGIGGSQVNKLETNVNQPTFAVAVALADALGVSTEAFRDGPGETAPETRPRGRPRKAPSVPQEPPAAAGQGQQPSGEKPAGRGRKRGE